MAIEDRDLKQIKKTQMSTAPAWLGRGANRGRKGWTGQGPLPPTAIPNWQEPMSNTGLTDRRVLDDNAFTGGTVMSMSNMLPGGMGAPTIQPPLTVPAWIANTFKPRPPAYGGSYNPTNMVTQGGQWNIPPWLGGNAETRQISPDLAAQVPQEPMPVYPISQTHPYGGLPAYMLPQPPEPDSGGSGGFGTYYGGNWRGGGGGGGGGYFNSPPAWAGMNLYDWRFKG